MSMCLEIGVHRRFEETQSFHLLLQKSNLLYFYVTNFKLELRATKYLDTPETTFPKTQPRGLDFISDYYFKKLTSTEILNQCQIMFHRFMIRIQAGWKWQGDGI
jgi:hypothetical protein